ncbi:hypothetical protein DVDV_1127 [Desulfovibrio sp. DV]|nr:hypothetical protein DVDV_1127 [Desulfovibrio sp. DV]
MIRDAHAVQASTPGVIEDIRKCKMAAWRDVAVHVNIEEHNMIFRGKSAV